MCLQVQSAFLVQKLSLLTNFQKLSTVLLRVSESVDHGSLAGQGRNFKGLGPGKGVRRSGDAWDNCLALIVCSFSKFDSLVLRNVRNTKI